MYIIEDLVSGRVVKVCDTEAEAKAYINNDKSGRRLWYSYVIGY